MARDIALGCRYLEENHFIHRWLSSLIFALKWPSLSQWVDRTLLFSEKIDIINSLQLLTFMSYTNKCVYVCVCVSGTLPLETAFWLVLDQTEWLKLEILGWPEIFTGAYYVTCLFFYWYANMHWVSYIDKYFSGRVTIGREAVPCCQSSGCHLKPS